MGYGTLPIKDFGDALPFVGAIDTRPGRHVRDQHFPCTSRSPK